jgi:hypothetical protein
MTMYAASKVSTRRSRLTAWAVAALTALVLLAASGGLILPAADAQEPVRAVRAGYAANTAAKQPPAKIIADPPKPEALARGVAIVQFRTENVQIVPVFGPPAAAVSPRLGHLHVTLDDATWHWGHTSNDPVIVAPLAPGPHSILLELADADHNILAKEVVKFEVPRQ